MQVKIDVAFANCTRRYLIKNYRRAHLYNGEYRFQISLLEKSQDSSFQKGNNTLDEYNQLTIQETVLHNNGRVATVFTRSNYMDVEAENLLKVVCITYDFKFLECY